MNKENQVNETRVATGGQEHEDPGTHPHALDYIAKVKATFGKQSTQYKTFTKILGHFLEETISPEEVGQRIATLFQGHDKLILGLNTFLPPDCQVVIKGNDSRFEEDPPLETELLAIKNLKQELEGLEEEKLLVQQQNLSGSNEEQSQELEDLEWKLVVVKETINNVNLGIELRSKKNATVQQKGSRQHLSNPMQAMSPKLNPMIGASFQSGESSRHQSSKSKSKMSHSGSGFILGSQSSEKPSLNRSNPGSYPDVTGLTTGINGLAIGPKLAPRKDPKERVDKSHVKLSEGQKGANFIEPN